MFTGIITNMGIVHDVIGHLDKTFLIQTNYNINHIKIGSSVACSGVCLTVFDTDNNLLKFDVSAETLSKTTLNSWAIGTKINLEQALKIGDELGGHCVTGHVDDVAVVHTLTQDARSWNIEIIPPENLLPFIASKGSITLDGISLTVNHITDTSFHVNIIPHTYQVTTAHEWIKGTKLNLEIDMMARYAVHYFKTLPPSLLK